MLVPYKVAPKLRGLAMSQDSKKLDFYFILIERNQSVHRFYLGIFFLGLLPPLWDSKLRLVHRINDETQTFLRFFLGFEPIKHHKNNSTEG